MNDILQSKIVVTAFVLGCLVPIFLSIFAMFVSFDTGVGLANVLFPFGAWDSIDDSYKILLNGLTYAGIAIAAVLVRNLFKPNGN